MSRTLPSAVIHSDLVRGINSFNKMLLTNPANRTLDRDHASRVSPAKLPLKQPPPRMIPSTIAYVIAHSPALLFVFDMTDRLGASRKMMLFHLEAASAYAEELGETTTLHLIDRTRREIEHPPPAEQAHEPKPPTLA